MPEDLPVTKCINVMVGITRSKVIVARGHFSHLKLGLFSINGLVELSLIHFTIVCHCLPLFTIVYHCVPLFTIVYHCLPWNQLECLSLSSYIPSISICKKSAPPQLTATHRWPWGERRWHCWWPQCNIRRPAKESPSSIGRSSRNLDILVI